MGLASSAERMQISTSEALERRDAAVSRRAVLRGAAGVVGAGVIGGSMTACAAPTSDEATAQSTAAVKRQDRVVIVGAGFAGLTAAYRLKQKGISSRVFDANNRISGRVSTLRKPQFAAKIELGAEFIDTGHVAMQGLVSELGLTLLNVDDARTAFEPTRYVIGNQRYTEAQIVSLFRPLAARIQADLSSIGGPTYITYNDKTPRGVQLDRLSIAEYLDTIGASGPMRTLLDIGYTAEFGLEIDQQTALNLIYLIGTDPDPFKIYGISDEVYTVKEGNDAVSTRMAATLGSPVELGHSLVSVRQRSCGSLLVTFERGPSTVEVVADRLVIAIPFNQLRKAELDFKIGSAKKKSIHQLAYGTNAKLSMGTSSRPWQAAGSSGNSFNDAVYQESWDSSRGVPTTSGVITDFSGGKLGLELCTGTTDFQARRVIERLDAIYPGMKTAFTGQAVRAAWPTQPFFEGSYACWAPGNYASFIGSEQEIEGKDKNVHFCGEHTSTDFQGYMEGAVATGERVATEIITALTTKV